MSLPDTMEYPSRLADIELNTLPPPPPRLAHPVYPEWHPDSPARENEHRARMNTEPPLSGHSDGYKRNPSTSSTSHSSHSETSSTGEFPSKRTDTDTAGPFEWNDLQPRDFTQGRVLMIDYISPEHGVPDGSPHVRVNHFITYEQLRDFYLETSKAPAPALRLIHVQNAPWARKYLVSKHQIERRSAKIRTTFDEWIGTSRPRGASDNPTVKTKVFPAASDSTRNIMSGAFGFDYLHVVNQRDWGWVENYRHLRRRLLRECRSSSSPNNANTTGPSSSSMSEIEDHYDKPKLIDLNDYDEDDNPIITNQVFVHRMTVYVQHRQKYTMASTFSEDNVMIIFDDSHSGSYLDTLIPACGQAETNWTRFSNIDNLTDTDLVPKYMDLILKDVFVSLERTWVKLFGLCNNHMDLLHNDVYSNPSDESRAAELWTNSNAWLLFNQLAMKHSNIILDGRYLLENITEAVPPNGAWMSGMMELFCNIPGLVQKRLIKPTDKLNDLLHKSIQMRDARFGVRVGASLWRLSWITFIFLPLTFTASFFQMNSAAYPDGTIVTWFIIVSLPVMVGVMLIWYIIKHTLTSEKNSPAYRRVYEDEFQRMATNYDRVWTREGPRDGVYPINLWGKIKWRLVKRWFDPKQLRQDAANQTGPTMGAWSRMKFYLARRWIAHIDKSSKIDEVPIVEAGLNFTRPRR